LLKLCSERTCRQTCAAFDVPDGSRDAGERKFLRLTIIAMCGMALLHVIHCFHACGKNIAAYNSVEQ